VQDVLHKPVSANELVPAIGRVLVRSGRLPEDALSHPAGSVVAFCATTAGAGCTTTAVNAALSLARLTGGPVALIDADYAGPAVGRMLGVASNRTLSDLARRGGRLEREPDLLFVTHESGVRVLTAPASPRRRKPLNRSQVLSAVTALRRLFPWSVVDVGPSHDEMGFAFLDAADLVVLTIESEIAALRYARLFLDQLYARGYPLSKVWVVANRDAMPGGMSVEELPQWLGVRVNYAIPYSGALAVGGLPAALPEQGNLAAAYDRLGRALLYERGGLPLAAPAMGAVAAMPAGAPPAPPEAAPLGGAPRAAGARRFALYGGLVVLLAILAVGAVLLMSPGGNQGITRGRGTAQPSPAAATGARRGVTADRRRSRSRATPAAVRPWLRRRPPTLPRRLRRRRRCDVAAEPDRDPDTGPDCDTCADPDAVARAFGHGQPDCSADRSALAGAATPDGAAPAESHPDANGAAHADGAAHTACAVRPVVSVARADRERCRHLLVATRRGAAAWRGL
jgi:MinD-like ATPase involved in chromosome partitioning or flagellar assembly